MAGAARVGMVAAALVAASATAACGGGGGSSAKTSSGSSSSTGSPAASSASSSSTSGSGGSGSAASSGGGFCALLTDAEVTAVINVPVARREPHSQASNESCIVGANRSDKPADFSFVSYSVLHGDTTVFSGASAQSDAQSISDVGKGALFVPSAGTLFVLAGDGELTVQVVKAGVPGSQDDAVALARLLVSRL